MKKPRGGKLDFGQDILRVVFHDDEGPNGEYGTLDIGKLQINIFPHDNAIETVDTLIHEALHYVDRRFLDKVLGTNGVKHPIIYKLSRALAVIFIRNWDFWRPILDEASKEFKKSAK